MTTQGKLPFLVPRDVPATRTVCNTDMKSAGIKPGR